MLKNGRRGFHGLSELDRSPADDPGDRCADERVAQVQPGESEFCLRQFNPVLERDRGTLLHLGLQLGSFTLSDDGDGIGQRLLTLLEPDLRLL